MAETEFDHTVDNAIAAEFHARCERINRLGAGEVWDRLTSGLVAKVLSPPAPSVIVRYDRSGPLCFGDDWIVKVRDAGFGWHMELFTYEYPTQGDSVLQTLYQFQSMAPMGDGRPLDKIFVGDATARIYAKSWKDYRPKTFSPVTLESFGQWLGSEEGRMVEFESSLGIRGIEKEIVPSLPELTYRPIKFGTEMLDLIDEQFDAIFQPQVS